MKLKRYSLTANKKAAEILAFKDQDVELTEMQKAVGLVGEMSYSTFRRHVHRIWAKAEKFTPQDKPRLPEPPENRTQAPPVQAAEAPISLEPPQASAPQTPKKRPFVKVSVEGRRTDWDPKTWKYDLS